METRSWNQDLRLSTSLFIFNKTTCGPNQRRLYFASLEYHTLQLGFAAASFSQQAATRVSLANQVPTWEETPTSVSNPVGPSYVQCMIVNKL